MLGRYTDTYDVTATDFAPFVGTTGISFFIGLQEYAIKKLIELA
jgi:hypothetical protein